jgi:hypothetical protein
VRPATTLALSGVMHGALHTHLFPGDGLEAAALLVCTRSPGPRVRLVARDMILVPHEACARRARDAITWPGAYIEEAIDLAEGEGLTIVLIHSHPGGLFAFSDVDDESDQRVLPSLFAACSEEHGSAIMIADGSVRARLYSADMRARPIDLVAVAGDDLRYFWSASVTLTDLARRPVAFTSDMSRELGDLTAGVIGVSGTGSIVGEQIGRLGFGKIVPIDFDRVELRNLNRIVNSTLADAAARRKKVEMFAAAVHAYRGAGIVEPLDLSIATREAVIVAAGCDVLFCCVDTLEARQIVDLISAAFLIPVFDVGVTIPTRKTVDGIAIGDVCGRIDYVQPGGATLGDRGVYTPESLRAEYLRKVAPEAHRQELQAGYIKGAVEEAPAVITLNMRAASACVNEFIARAYPFRLDPNRLYARTTFSLAACEEEYTAEDGFTTYPLAVLGRGAREPLLGLPMFGPRITKPRS